MLKDKEYKADFFGEMNQLDYDSLWRFVFSITGRVCSTWSYRSIYTIFWKERRIGVTFL